MSHGNSKEAREEVLRDPLDQRGGDHQGRPESVLYEAVSGPGGRQQDGLPGEGHLPALTVLSLGWGRQSFALAGMIALGELPPVGYAIFADTKHEAAGTYAHAKKYTPWLEERGVRVVTVTSTRSDVVTQAKSPSVMIPAFTTDPETGDHGQIKRQCTSEWKIRPIRRFIRSVIGAPTPGSVLSLQGISLDEWQRMRSSDVAYIVNTYPLVDRRITRTGCVEWLVAHGLDVPPKSSCTFCPFHSRDHWKALKRAGGSDWNRAVQVDAAIREKRPKASLYIHPGRVPLAEAVKIPEDQGAHQLELGICDGGFCDV